MNEATSHPLSQVLVEPEPELEPTNDKKTIESNTIQSNKPDNSWLVPILVNIFLACASFSIIKPSLAPYLIQIGISESFLTWVIFIHNIGGLVGSAIIGLLYEYATRICKVEGRGARICFLMCPLFGIAGSALYAFAGWIGNVDVSSWFVMIGSFLMGIWGGGQQAVELGEGNDFILSVLMQVRDITSPIYLIQRIYQKLLKLLSKQNMLQH